MGKRKLLAILLVFVFAAVSMPQTAFAATKAPKKIKLNKTKVTMYVGESQTLKTTFTPKKANKSVVWKSSNKKVVKVTKKGKIKALKPGKATITCTSKVNKKVKVKCKVTVKKVVKPKKIKLSDSSILLDVGYSYTLKATVSPTKAYKYVKWNSSDTSIVTVNSKGKCVGVSPGKAVITCSSKKFPKIKAKCTVEVKKPGGAVDDETLLEDFEILMSRTGEALYLRQQGQSVTYKDDSSGGWKWDIETNANGTVKFITAYANWTNLGSTYCTPSTTPYMTFGAKPGNATDIRDSVMNGTYDFTNNPDDVKIGWLMWTGDSTKASIEKMLNCKISDTIYNNLISYRKSLPSFGSSVVIVYGMNEKGVLTGRYAGYIILTSNAVDYTLVGTASDNADEYGKIKTGYIYY